MSLRLWIKALLGQLSHTHIRNASHIWQQQAQGYTDTSAGTKCKTGGWGGATNHENMIPGPWWNLHGTLF